MQPTDPCLLLHFPAFRLLMFRCTLVWASRSAGDRVPLVLASYQRPACSPPALEWFGSIPPNVDADSLDVLHLRSLSRDFVGYCHKTAATEDRLGAQETAGPHPLFLE